VTTPGLFTPPPERLPDHAPHARQMEHLERRDRRRAWVVIVVVMALAGLLSGIVWAFAAPEVHHVMTELGPVPETELEADRLVGMDGWYGILAGGVGLVVGAFLAASYLRHGVTMVLALLVGSSAAAILSVVMGSLVANGAIVFDFEPRVPPGSRLVAPLTLHAYGFMLVWPIAALAPVVPLAWFGWLDYGDTSDSSG